MQQGESDCRGNARSAHIAKEKHAQKHRGPNVKRMEPKRTKHKLCETPKIPESKSTPIFACGLSVPGVGGPLQSWEEWLHGYVDHKFSLPSHIPDVHTIRSIHQGLWLGHKSPAVGGLQYESHAMCGGHSSL